MASELEYLRKDRDKWVEAWRKAIGDAERMRLGHEAEVAALKAQADPQTDAQVQEQVAAIVYAAMRFAREDVTPEWQAGNSHAEYRARQAATEIAEMLRCALKAQADPLPAKTYGVDPANGRDYTVIADIGDAEQMRRCHEVEKNALLECIKKQDARITDLETRREMLRGQMMGERDMRHQLHEDIDCVLARMEVER